MLIQCPRCGNAFTVRLDAIRDAGAACCHQCGRVVEVDLSVPLRRMRAVCACCEALCDLFVAQGAEERMTIPCRRCRAPIDVYWDARRAQYRALSDE